MAPQPQPRRPAGPPLSDAPKPVPWHFKLIAVGAGIYVALRVVQMLGWVGVGVVQLHNGTAIALIVLNGLVALWGLLGWWGKVRLIQGYLLLARLGWLLFVPQVLLGVWLYSQGHRAPLGWQHYIYGVGAALGIGAGEFYRRRLPGREGMVLGLAGLFLMGVAIRAFMTGHGIA
jgi:hypothetical protein